MMNIEVNGINLHYQCVGTGPAILLLHGNGGSHKMFDPLVNRLANYYTVYAIDSRGHGKSTKVKHLSYHDKVKDVVCLIKQLQIEKPIVYGFSDGGIIGLMMASKYPDLLSKLIVSGANTNPDAIKANWRYLIKFLACVTGSPKLRLMLNEPQITKVELNRIKIPVLVLAGERDVIKYENTLFIAENMPQSQVRILPKETHGSYVKNNAKLYSLIKIFIKKAEID